MQWGDGGIRRSVGEVTNHPGKFGPPNGGLGGFCSRRGLVQRDAPPCRRRKVRSAPFPPAAKTASAPLHPKGTSAPTPWAWTLRLSPPRGARRGPLIGLARKENGPHPQGVTASVKRQSRQRLRSARSKRKGRLGALRCSGPPATGGGGSVQAPIWPGLRAHLGLLRFL